MKSDRLVKVIHKTGSRRKRNRTEKTLMKGNEKTGLRRRNTVNEIMKLTIERGEIG